MLLMTSNENKYGNRLGLLSWIRMVRFYQKCNQLSNEYLEQFGLSISQFETLAQIFIHQPVSQQKLAQHLTISHGGVSHMLKRLEKEKLIARKQDWKLKYISLTDKGQEIMEKVMPLQSSFQSSFFDVLSEEEKQNLNEIMLKLHKYSFQKTVPSYLDCQL